MKVTLISNSSSISENSTYSFFIEGISNILFQELIAYKKGEHSISPLKELKKEYAFSYLDTLRASKYIVITENTNLNEKSIKSLEDLRISLQSNADNKIEEEMLPLYYKRSLICDFKKEKLQELVALADLHSTSSENKKFAKTLYKAFPKEHRKLFDEPIIEKGKM